MSETPKREAAGLGVVSDACDGKQVSSLHVATAANPDSSKRACFK